MAADALRVTDCCYGCSVKIIAGEANLVIARAVGERIRANRLARKLTQEALAEACGLHRTYIGTVERGEQNITVASLMRIAHALQLPAGQLLDGLPDVRITNSAPTDEFSRLLTRAGGQHAESIDRSGSPKLPARS